MLACFNYGRLYGEGNWGHVSVIESMQTSEHALVQLVDPEKNVPKHRTVELAKLIDAMEYHGVKNRAGFWVIKSR